MKQTQLAETEEGRSRLPLAFQQARDGGASALGAGKRRG